MSDRHINNDNTDLETEFYSKLKQTIYTTNKNDYSMVDLKTS
jgi:hypothetical protein